MLLIMKKSLLLVSTALTCMQPLRAATLGDLYQAALKKNENLAIGTLTTLKAHESVRTYTSSLYPSIDLNSRARFGNETYKSRNGLKRWDTQTGIGLTQNLFQGGAEFALWELKKNIPQIAKEEERSTYHAFYAELASSFYSYLSSTQEKQKIRRQMNGLERRIRILQRRVKIGRDRDTDLLASKAQLARLHADLSAIENTIVIAATELRTLTGLETLPEISDDTDPRSLRLPSNSQQLLKERPIQKSADLALKQSQEEVRVEKSEYYPQLSLSSNYYLDQYRSGRDDFDVTLEFKLNILDFGVTKSNVAVAKVDEMIAQKRSEQVARIGTETLQNFERTLMVKKDQLRNLDLALKATEASYKRQVEDANKGLVSQLDVIQSLDSVITLERLGITTAGQIKALYHQALAFLGQVPKENK